MSATTAPAWDVRHLDVSGLPSVLPMSESAAGAYIVFWRDGAPVGQRWLERAEWARAGGTIEAPNELCDDAVVARSDLVGRATVIVCPRNRPEHLLQCLQSLQRLNAPPGEIVVVDNGTDPERIRSLCSGFGSVVYARESR